MLLIVNICVVINSLEIPVLQWSSFPVFRSLEMIVNLKNSRFAFRHPAIDIPSLVGVCFLMSLCFSACASACLQLNPVVNYALILSSFFV